MWFFRYHFAIMGILGLFSCQKDDPQIFVIMNSFERDTLIIQYSPKGENLHEGGSYYGLFLDSLNQNNIYEFSTKIKAHSLKDVEVALINNYKSVNIFSDSCIYFDYARDNDKIKRIRIFLTCKNFKKSINKKEELRKYY